MMAGWVIDELGVFGPGQEDPQNGRWASGTSAIDAATAPDGTQSRFGTGQTPAMALLDLLQNNTTAQVVFGDETDDALSTIHVPTTDVLENHGPGWLDDRFGDADDVEAYNGYDGHGYAVYANWTLDTGGHCNNGDCAAPMVVRLPVGSKAHAFFNLGWAIHLVEDNTTPVHTTSDSITTSEVHNDIEGMADRVLDSRISVPAGSVDRLLPTVTAPDFAALYDYPPSNCPDQLGSDADPAGLYKTRWYAKPLSPSDPDVLVPAPGEGVAHAYTRQAAMTMHRYMPYISCINTEDDANWPTMGFFTALGLDLEVKAVAGVIRQFIEDVDTTPPTVTIVRPTATAYPHFGTLTLSYSATDDESGIKSGSVTATIDGNTTLGTPPHGLASGQPINLLTELSLGAHTFQVSATDNASNVSSPSVAFTLIVTASSIIDDVNYFLSTGAITSRNEANSLLKKLQAAAAYRAKGDCKDASATYVAFINEVRAQTGKTISATAATIMIGDAQYLVSNCP